MYKLNLKITWKRANNDNKNIHFSLINNNILKFDWSILKLFYYNIIAKISTLWREVLVDKNQQNA